MIFKEIRDNGFEAQFFIGGLSRHFRDLLVSKDPVTLPLLEVSESVAKRYGEQAEKCTLPFLYRAMELSNRCDLDYRISNNKQFLVELTLIQICQITNPVTSAPENPPLQKITPAPNAGQTVSPTTQTPNTTTSQQTAGTTSGVTQTAEPRLHTEPQPYGLQLLNGIFRQLRRKQEKRLPRLVSLYIRNRQNLSQRKTHRPYKPYSIHHSQPKPLPQLGWNTPKPYRRKSCSSIQCRVAAHSSSIPRIS